MLLHGLQIRQLKEALDGGDTAAIRQSFRPLGKPVSLAPLTGSGDGIPGATEPLLTHFGNDEIA
jgi:hypothetical protein